MVLLQMALGFQTIDEQTSYQVVTGQYRDPEQGSGLAGQAADQGAGQHGNKDLVV